MKFTADKLAPLGDFDNKYGQRYWGTVEESDLSVSFNLMSPVDILPGQTVEYEEKVIKETGPNSKNPGTEYLFLRKVKVDGAKPLPEQTATTDGDIERKLDAIAGDVKMVLSFMRQLQKKVENPLDAVVDVDENEEISLQDIPF